MRNNTEHNKVKNLMSNNFKTNTMNTNKTFYHIIEEFGSDFGYQGYSETEEEAEQTIKDLSSKFKEPYFWIFTSNSNNEPPIITV